MAKKKTVKDVEAEESFEEANIPDTVSEEDMADAQALLREYGESPAEEVEDVQPVIEENFETEENISRKSSNSKEVSLT